MDSRKEQAVSKKLNGYNCAQAVACTYCDYVGMSEETMAALTQGFGAGIGGTMDGTCGAITGACTVVGLADAQAGRMKAMKDAGYIMSNFHKNCGSVTCRELKGIESGKMLKSCEDCVKEAAALLEDVLNSEN
ncbi:MAG: C-GCAxxG-C-C family protein [Lachnospiraceae bacterium]|nr:C-GCAxxG-C-C family protein [Lachnospiraceae bacterium]